MPPFVPTLPLVKDGSTVGQALLLLPWIILFLAAYDRTFNNPSVESGGDVASYAIFAAFLTASKGTSIWYFCFGLSFERMVPIHNLYACLAVILSFFHGYVAYYYGETTSGDDSDDRRRLSGDSEYSRLGAQPNVWKFMWDGGTNLTGSLCTACLVGLLTLSFFRVVRKYLYEPWLFSHILFSVGVILFGLLHSVTFLIVPLVWWMLDYAVRLGGHSLLEFPTQATLCKLGDDLVQVRFRNTRSFRAGQFVHICVPAVSPFQFHPITVASTPTDKEVSLFIRGLGGWSRALVDRANETTHEQLTVLIQGPYGNLSLDLDLDNGNVYPIVLCISGGIGVTVCQSVVRYVIQQAEKGRALVHLRFAWVIRHVDMMNELPTVVADASLWSDLEKKRDSDTPRFQPDVYVTKADNKDLADCPAHVHKGRPDIKHLVEETVALAISRNIGRVAVITCGPERMVDEVQQTCRQMSGMCGKVALDVHKESFNF